MNDIDESMTEQGSERPGTVDRRTMIKGAAVAGVLVWTAPMIIDSMASPAAAGTPTEGCFKYQFNWWLVPQGGVGGPDQGTALDYDHNLMLKFNQKIGVGYKAEWNQECQSSVDGTKEAGDIEDIPGQSPKVNTEGFKSNDLGPSNSCCDSPEWWASDETNPDRELVETWDNPECVEIILLKDGVMKGAGCPGDPLLKTGEGFNRDTPVNQIKFQMICDNCWFIQPQLINVTDNPYAFEPSFGSTLSSGGSNRYDSILIDFSQVAPPNRRWPIYLKVWVYCGPEEGVGDDPPPGLRQDCDVLGTVTIMA